MLILSKDCDCCCLTASLHVARCFLIFSQWNNDCVTTCTLQTLGCIWPLWIIKTQLTYSNHVPSVWEKNEEVILLQRLPLCQKWLDTLLWRRVIARELKKLLEWKWLFTSHSVHLSEQSPSCSLRSVIGSDKRKVIGALWKKFPSVSHRFLLISRSNVYYQLFECIYIFFFICKHPSPVCPHCEDVVVVVVVF